MKTVQILLGAALIIGGVIFAIWAGAWWAFVGGIILVINSIVATPLDAFGIAFGILRICSAGLIFWISFLISFVVGLSVLESKSSIRIHKNGRRF